MNQEVHAAHGLCYYQLTPEFEKRWWFDFDEPCVHPEWHEDVS